MVDDARGDERPRLLVLRPGAIGDTLLTIPALLALRQRFPEHRIEVVGNVRAAPFVVATGAADGWTSFDDATVTRLFVPSVPAPDDLFYGIDVAVAWCADPDGALAEGLRERGAREVIVAQSRPPANRAIHVARYLVSTLSPLGIPKGLPDLPRLSLPPDALRSADDLLATPNLDHAPFMVVHPGSGSPAKNWPAERFAEVVRSLRSERSVETVILAGPADSATVRTMLERLDVPPVVLRDLPLAVAGALMRRADACLGNDSGLSHLAGLLGCRTLALFGPTDPALWKPLGPHVRTIRREPLAALQVDEVLGALRSILDSANAEHASPT